MGGIYKTASTLDILCDDKKPIWKRTINTNTVLVIYDYRNNIWTRLMIIVFLQYKLKKCYKKNVVNNVDVYFNALLAS